MLPANLQNNTIYTLSALIGERALDIRFNVGFNDSLQLWAGSSLLASASNLNLTGNSFGSDAAVYSSGANNPLAGQALKVVLTTTGLPGGYQRRASSITSPWTPALPPQRRLPSPPPCFPASPDWA